MDALVSFIFCVASPNMTKKYVAATSENVRSANPFRSLDVPKIISISLSFSSLLQTLFQAVRKLNLQQLPRIELLSNLALRQPEAETFQLEEENQPLLAEVCSLCFLARRTCLNMFSLILFHQKTTDFFAAAELAEPTGHTCLCTFVETRKEYKVTRPSQWRAR